MKPILTLSGRLIASFTIMLFIQLVASYMFPENLQLYVPSLAITVWIMLTLFDKDQIELHIQQKKIFSQQAKGFLLGILLISLAFVFIWVSQAIYIRNVTFNTNTLRSVISTTFLFFIVAFHEEIFFRGYLYSLSQNLFHKKIAIIFTSVVFALMHSLNPNVLSNPLPLINIFLAGLFLALLREYSNGIWLPIGFHWSWNLFQGTIFGFHVSGLSMQSVIQLSPVGHSLLSGGNFGAEGSILTSIILLGSIMTVTLYNKRRTDHKSSCFSCNSR